MQRDSLIDQNVLKLIEREVISPNNLKKGGIEKFLIKVLKRRTMKASLKMKALWRK